MEDQRTDQTPEIEFILMRTLILKPDERSVRRARLRSGRFKQLIVPGSVSQVSYGLPRPELFIIRSLGSKSGGYIAVNPVAVRAARHKFDPLGVREFTWVQDLTADPIVNKLIFENRITGQFLGECELTESESETLNEWTEHLGGPFEITIEAGFSMSIKQPDKPISLFSLVPTKHQVSCLDYDIILLTNMSNARELDIISQIYHVFYMAWKKERFDSVALLSMLNAFSEQTKVLDSHLLTVSQTLIRSKVKALGAMRDYVLHPLDTQKLLDPFPKHLQEVQQKVTKRLQEWSHALEADQPLTAGVVKTIISTELADIIPLDSSWWTQLKLVLSPACTEQLHLWTIQQALTMPNVNTQSRPIYQNSSLWEYINREYMVVDLLENLGLEVSMRRPKPVWAQSSSFHLTHMSRVGHLDQFSLLKATNHPQLNLCSEYPSAAIDCPPRLLFMAAKSDRDFCTPESFISPRGVAMYSIPSSHRHLLMLAGIASRRQLEWYVVGLRGYFKIQPEKLHPSEVGKFVCMHGKFMMKPESKPEEVCRAIISQSTSSRAHLYFLRVEDEQRAVLRVPLGPNDPPCEVHHLATNQGGSHTSKKVRPYVALEERYSVDPRFSHVFSFFESVQKVLLAEVQLECPAELYPDDGELDHQICLKWRQDLCHLEKWRLKVSLTAVKSQKGLPMNTVASNSWDFRLIDPVRMLGNIHYSQRLYGHEDICFQFRWRQLRCLRIFGLWMRDRQAYTVFVLRNNRFTIAVQRPPRILGHDRIESLVGSSMRDYELPIVFARCESCKPGGDFTFHLHTLKLAV